MTLERRKCEKCESENTGLDTKALAWICHDCGEKQSHKVNYFDVNVDNKDDHIHNLEEFAKFPDKFLARLFGDEEDCVLLDGDAIKFFQKECGAKTIEEAQAIARDMMRYQIMESLGLLNDDEQRS